MKSAFQVSDASRCARVAGLGLVVVALAVVALGARNLNRVAESSKNRTNTAVVDSESRGVAGQELSGETGTAYEVDSADFGVSDAAAPGSGETQTTAIPRAIDTGDGALFSAAQLNETPLAMAESTDGVAAETRVAEAPTAAAGVAVADEADTSATWNVLVYMAAEADSEARALADFQKFASVKELSGVQVALQLDLAGAVTQRYVIKPGATAADTVSDWGDGLGGREVNMGSTAALSEFVEWGGNVLPADHTILILWGAPVGGCGDIAPSLCGDSSGDALMPVEAAAGAAGVDIVLADVAGQSTIELAADLAAADVETLVAAELTTGSAPYGDIITALAAPPNENVLRATAMLAKYLGARVPVVSAVKLEKVPAVVAALDSLAGAMRSEYADPDSAAVAAAATNLREKLGLATLRASVKNGTGAYHGLGIYFPTSVASCSADYAAANFALAAETDWDKFLADYAEKMEGSKVAESRLAAAVTGAPNCVDLYDFCDKLAPMVVAEQAAAVTADGYEPDNSAGSAHTIESAQSQRRNCHTAFDDDWATFTLTERSIVVIGVDNRGGLAATEDAVIELFSADNLTQSIEYNDDGGTGYQANICRTLDPGVYYILVDPYIAEGEQEGDGDAIESYNLTLTVNPVGTLITRANGVAAGTPDQYEAAGNNSFATAREIVFRHVETHSLHDGNDKDYFKFSVSQSGKLWIETINPIAGWLEGQTFQENVQANIKMTVYDENMTVIGNGANLSGGDLYYGSDNMPAGTYYIMIESADNTAALQYGIRIDTNLPSGPPVYPTYPAHRGFGGGGCGMGDGDVASWYLPYLAVMLSMVAIRFAHRRQSATA